MHRSDTHLLRAVAETVARPKRDPADSFVLHASLELLARAALLARVPPAQRTRARERLRWLAAAYDAAGDPVDEPRSVTPEPARLLAALRAGDLDAVDEQAVALASVASPAELRRLLAAPVLSSLGAAAHGAILLHLLARVPLPGGWPLGLVRQALREMARTPGWQLRWVSAPPSPPSERPLVEVLLDVPRLGLPGSDYIHPVMSQAEDSGIAPRLLAGVREDRVVAERVLARVAAWSMLQEPDEHVPYGWTHCLTMPQGAVRLADVVGDRLAVAVAATYVVGFRAAEGTVELDPAAPVPPADDEASLAEYAAGHEDAHLAKYALACFDAAVRDPAARDLHLAAATRLVRWWQDRDRSSPAPLTA